MQPAAGAPSPSSPLGPDGATGGGEKVANASGVSASKQLERAEKRNEDMRGSDPNMRATSDPYYLGSSAALQGDSYGQVATPHL